MNGTRSSRFTLACVTVMVFFGAASVLYAQSVPAPATGLKVNGLVTPYQLTSSSPTLSWTKSPQYSYQIQMNNTNDAWSGGNFCPWFWDSGEVVSSSNSRIIPSGESDTCAPNASTFKQAIHRSPDRIYWRIRVRETATDAWSDWAMSWFSMNQYPAAPVVTVLATGTGAGTNTVGTLATGTQRHVGSGQTYATIGAAVTAAACGDTVVVHAGQYAESISVSSKNCSINAPLRVRANTGDSPVLTQAIGGTPVIKFVSSTNVSVEGFHLSGAAGRSAVDISTNSSNIRVSNLYMDDTFSSSSASVFLARGSNLVLERSRIFNSGSTCAYAGIESTDGSLVTIRGNDFSGALERVIAFHGVRERGGHIVRGNYVHDLTGPSGNGIIVFDNYYGAQNARYERNVVLGDGRTTIWRLQRSGVVLVAHNLTKGGAQVFDNYQSGGRYTVHSNVFMNAATVYASSASPIPDGPSSYNYYGPHCPNYKDEASGSPNTSWDIDGNVYFNNSRIDQVDVVGCLTHGPNECTGGAQCDPKLDSDGDGVYNETYDIHPTASSTALIDKADSGDPVPVGGGPRADIGRFEFGAAPIANVDEYSYQPLVAVGTLVPKISWAFRDIDNDRSGSSISTQGRYRVRIDQSPTFDSLGPNRPLVDSGVVTSSATEYNVPTGVLTDLRTYYVTISTSDSTEPGALGTWSDTAWAIRTDLSGTGGGTGTPPTTPAHLRRTDSKTP